MKCEKCGKNTATTHIRSVMNGVVYEKNLCEYCAAAEGVSVSSTNGLAGIIASMFGDVLESKSQNTKKCPVCGATFDRIAESGKVGCADCYKTFKTELLPYLKRIHGGTKHIGKTPDISPSQDTGIDLLRSELQRLVAEEKYEEAAVIRDKIKEIEGEANG